LHAFSTDSTRSAPPRPARQGMFCCCLFGFFFFSRVFHHAMGMGYGRNFVPRHLRCLGRHRPKGRSALVRVRWDGPVLTVIVILKGEPIGRPVFAEYRRTPAVQIGSQSLRRRGAIANTQCPGYRTAEPSDSPPWASRYAHAPAPRSRPAAADRDPTRPVPTRRGRAQQGPGPLRAHKGSHAPQFTRSRPRRRRSRFGKPQRSRRHEGRERDRRRRPPSRSVRPELTAIAIASSVLWVRSARSLMVAAAARRQGASP
jgi:hypothetical protein